jgi:hypothetical protein
LGLVIGKPPSRALGSILRFPFFLFLVLCVVGVPKVYAHKELVILGKWSRKELDELLRDASRIKDTGKRIDFLSKQFLGVPYKGHTLIGNLNVPEVFVINLKELDCFTYIDYVEAMRLSNSFDEFKERLKEIRYRYGYVDFKHRNHFFTDWIVFNSRYVDDVTREVGREKTRVVDKVFNSREDGSFFLPGISPVLRRIYYIPSYAVDDSVVGRLKTGDYVGVYSDKQGLDVSHTGIVIKYGNKTYLRHASSRRGIGRVLDEDLKSYILGKPGLVVIRPK